MNLFLTSIGLFYCCINNFFHYWCDINSNAISLNKRHNWIIWNRLTHHNSLSILRNDNLTHDLLSCSFRCLYTKGYYNLLTIFSTKLIKIKKVVFKNYLLFCHWKSGMSITSIDIDYFSCDGRTQI